MTYTDKEYQRHTKLLKRLKRKIGNPDVFEIQADSSVKVGYSGIVKVFHMKQRIDIFTDELMDEVHALDMKEALNGVQAPEQPSNNPAV